MLRKPQEVCGCTPGVNGISSADKDICPKVLVVPRHKTERFAPAVAIYERGIFIPSEIK